MVDSDHWGLVMARVYHLPLTKESAEKFLGLGSEFEHAIEAAGMFAAFNALRKPSAHPVIDRLISDAYPLFQKAPQEGHEQLVQLRESLASRDVGDFVQSLLDLSVTLVDVEVIESRRWRGPDGHYTHAFQSHCIDAQEAISVVFHPLRDEEGDSEALDDGVGDDTPRRTPLQLLGSRDQSSVIRLIANAPGERVSIEAYAGTGKTFLLHALRDHLPEGFTFVVPNKEQGEALNAHSAASSRIRFTALNALAGRLASIHAQAAGLAFVPKLGYSEWSTEMQAEMAAIDPIGAASLRTVMRRMGIGISAWCRSPDSAIRPHHFARAGVLDRSELPLYVAAAERLWRAMFSPPLRRGQAFEIWAHHIGKWLESRGAGIIGQRGVLVVDEAHDLSPAWGRLFDSYSGGCVLLGDPHQRLRGVGFRSEQALSTTMTTSLRTGVQAADLIERTLDLSPHRTMTRFASSREHVTRVHRYSSAKELPEHGLRLFGSEWALFEAAQRRKNADAPFAALPASIALMERNVRNALTLFSGRATWYGLRVNGHRTWESLAADLHQRGLQAIVRMFERGFDEEKLSELLTFEKRGRNSSLTLGLMDHAKNLEFPMVALAPCCYGDAAAQRAFEPVHASYLAMTRAQQELWVPGDATDRLSDLRARPQS